MHSQKTRTMARIPGAAVVAAFLLFGTRDADAFQSHPHVASFARPSRTVRPNGSSALDMMSVFGRDVQVRVSEEIEKNRWSRALIPVQFARWPKTLTQ